MQSFAKKVFDQNLLDSVTGIVTEQFISSLALPAWVIIVLRIFLSNVLRLELKLRDSMFDDDELAGACG